ncbi:unnamed protein product [Haemonchus placei]|uniref:Structure-specific endonuclease subunit SLX4 n=1 Tax=Haemonchus placei TaxID=6290 RepID=A0A158QPL5_HAEPC|nr:unnamed protein product [Haemonchus placei]
MPLPPQQIYYCRIRNCQRTCGLVHRDSRSKLLSINRMSSSLDKVEGTKDPPKKSSTAPTAPEKKKRVKRKGRQEGINSDAKGNIPPRRMSTFEEVMERAIRKEALVIPPNQSVVSIVLPPNLRLFQTSKLDIVDTSPIPPSSQKSANEKRKLLAPSVSLDTTTIHFDQPVWDNPELREQLLDSEEEFDLDAVPPALKEDSLNVDEIISEATHAIDYNPIDHDRQDEMISGWSSDDGEFGIALAQVSVFKLNGRFCAAVRQSTPFTTPGSQKVDDYTTVDLSQIRKEDDHHPDVVPVRKHVFQNARYEMSLDVADHT